MRVSTYMNLMKVDLKNYIRYEHKLSKEELLAYHED